MKTIDIRKKSPADLHKSLTAIEAELRGIRFGTSSGGSKNNKKARTLKKDIARIKTVMHETT